MRNLILVGFAAGVAWAESECEGSAWWNPFAAFKAVRSASQNPILVTVAAVDLFIVANLE